jgi:Tfp pilus assembly protein FimV
VMARISELAAMEPKYREIQKSLSDAQTVIAGKDASIRNLQTDLAAATARLSAYEQKEKDEQASRIETLVENAIAEGKIDREAKTQWVEMAGSNFELAESTLASIPAREKISKEIADDPANIQATAEATKTAEQLMAEKVAEVVGADFKFRKL